MVFIKYITMYKVHMHAGAIRRLLYGGDDPFAKTSGLSSHTYAQTIHFTLVKTIKTYCLLSLTRHL